MTKSSDMQIEPHQLDQIQSLYSQGLCLQAYELARQLGPLHEWRGTAARILAGRLAANLGADRLHQWLHLRAWKNDRTDPVARYFYARLVMERHGPFATWKLLRRFENLDAEAASDAPQQLRAEWQAFYAYVLGLLRDFDAADECLALAEKLDPANPWICIERAAVLEAEDRYPESLAAARRSLELRPWYRPGVQATAHVLQLLDRDAEALELLTEAASHIESGPVVAQLAALQMEMGAYEAAAQSCDRFVELSPLMEKAEASWLAAVRSDIAYQQGDSQAAIRFAREAESPFHEQIATRLEAATPDDRRVLLPIPFVRQHHMTCAPATLAAVSRFWSLPADHLSIAEEICYDGTSDYSERNWAEQNGWCVREFTVTWEIAVALLDRSFPFTLTTIQATNAHLQAVIGYDSRRGTLLIRDPYHRPLGEAIADGLLENQHSTGPRGMAMIPTDGAKRLDGIDLPDAPVYDLLYRLNHCLQRHDRSQAQAIYETMCAEYPEHRLTVYGRRALAGYDADPTESLACVNLLLERFPDEPHLQLARLSYLSGIERRDERLKLLQEICERKDSHPIFWQQYAQELSDDAREHDTALRWINRSLRVMPLEAGSFYILAGILWDQQQRSEALALYRLAACLSDKNEHLSQSYFMAARHFKQTDAVLRFLESRFRRFGHRSGQPARTLFRALNEVDRTPQAFEVLEEALQLRPDDGDLRLFAAEVHGRYGHLQQADDLLNAARGKAARTAWLRTAAALASYRGERETALGLWQEVLKAEPLAMDAHTRVARLIAETDSPAASLAHFQEVAARFPHHYALHQLWAEWSREHDPPSAEGVLRHLIEIDPADAWAHRELALALSEQRRIEEAFAEVEIASHLRPLDSFNYGVRGEICSNAGQWQEAKVAYKEAIRLAVDNGFAVTRLMYILDSPAERRAALEFIESELVRQTIFGDGLLAFREAARDTLDGEELLASLRKALEARPDLWHAWSAVVRQLIDLDRLDEALELARLATARFPLLPVVWIDLALVHQARLQPEEERAALRQALQIDADSDLAIRQLSQSYERDRRYEDSKALLESAVRRDPLDAYKHGWLAEALWQTEEKDAALECLTRALQLEPGLDWAWEMLRDWCREQGRPQEAAALARDLTVRRSGEARSWMMLAKTLSEPEDLPERLAALEQAIALSPRFFEAYDLRAELLAETGRFDEALEACRTPAGEQIPSGLKGRMAWIHAQRGDVEEAIAQMRAVVEEDPNYYWGWRQLARWSDEAGAVDEYLEAARAMVRLAPQDPMAHGLLGDAKLQAGDRAGAKAEFCRALEMSPQYGYAGMSLYEAQLEDNEFDAAAATLDTLMERIGDEVVLARMVELAIRRKDQTTAAKRLRELCVYPAQDGEALRWAAHLMQEADWGEVTEQVLGEVLEAPEVQPVVGDLWVRARAARKDWKCERRLPELVARGQIGVFAMAAYVTALAEANRRWALRRFIREHRDMLRGHTLTWGNTGYALYAVGDFQKTIEWLSDWQERSGVESWMLLNLAVALRYLGKKSDAAEVHHAARVLSGAEHASEHPLWLAIDAALAHDADSATKYLADIEVEALDAFYRFLHLLVEVMLEMQAAQPGETKVQFASACKRLKEAQSVYPEYRKDRLSRQVYHCCVRCIARDVGGAGANIWRFLQMF